MSSLCSTAALLSMLETSKSSMTRMFVPGCRPVTWIIVGDYGTAVSIPDETQSTRSKKRFPVFPIEIGIVRSPWVMDCFYYQGTDFP